MKQKKEGFRLWEALVALAVLAVLGLSVVPLFRAQRENMGEKLDRANENAAKLAAAILYYGSGETAGTDFVRYYDAENNALVSEAPTPYGWGTAGGEETAENRGKFIRMEVSEGSFTLQWVIGTDEQMENPPEERGWRE